MDRAVECVLLENQTPEAIEKAINQLVGLDVPEEDPMCCSLLIEYLEIRRKEAEIEKLPYSSKKAAIEEVQKQCTRFLCNVIELWESLELSLTPQTIEILEKTKNDGYIKREEKILLTRKRSQLKEAAKETKTSKAAIGYAALEIGGRMEALQIEKNILDVPRPAQPLEAGGARPLQVQKITSLNHPVRISGKVLREDMKAILAQENGPVMSVEEYGEKIKHMIGQQQRAPDRGFQNTELSEDSDSKTESEGELERTRKKEDTHEFIHRGDGNRLGKK